jgi:uncharacterized protein
MNVQAILERRRREREELLERAHSFVASIERQHPLRAAVVFGSVARGDFNLWSDVDLLLIIDGFEELGFLERLDELGERPPRVQPIVWTPEEWKRQLERRNAIAMEGSESGVWLREAEKAG